MENKIIAVNYKLYVSSVTEAPELEEETKPGQPFEFCSGLGFTLEKFEKELINLSEGDKFDFTIKAADAYGEYDEANKQDLDKSIFIVDGKLHEGVVEGEIIPLMSEDGRRFQGVVDSINENTVTIDFNHPLAGYDLNFVGDVVVSHVASNEELSAYINPSCGGCGGSCNCSGDCSDDSSCNCGGCH